MSDSQNTNCPCPERLVLPVSIEGLKVSLDPESLPCTCDLEEIMEAARQAQQTADTAQGKADEAFDLAANADARAENANNTATEALDAAQNAQSAAEQANTVANEAKDTAQNALDTAGRAMGLYTVLTADGLDADSYTANAEKLYPTGSELLNFPVTAPFYFDVHVNDAGTSVTQTVRTDAAGQIRFSRCGQVDPATKVVTWHGGWRGDTPLEAGSALIYNGKGEVAVDFDQMPTDKFQELLKQLRVPIWLSRNTTWYVDGANGSDATTDTPEKGQTLETAFKTIKAAVNYVSANFNMETYTGTIIVSPGTYVERVSLPKYQASTGSLRISGTAKENTIVIGCFNVIPAAGPWSVQNFTVKSDGAVGPGSSFNTSLVIVYPNASLSLTNVVLDGDTVPESPARATTCLSVSGGTCTIGLLDMTLTERGKGRIFISVEAGGKVRMTQDCSMNGWQNNATISVIDGSMFIRGNLAGAPLAVLTGTVSGNRYNATYNSIINVGKGGPDFIPGTSIGSNSISTGAQYE